ncbi:DUF192 domain-containing protein [Anaeromyxobacter paludicola]|uniref:DUF192 domain-containing protein n=1 Tax=Anaeromyxobacter paludicola TaxID=2918171 RepID=A0ABN6N2G1_9BACT|nr:DUF192 domain-containing protein [Anaeromyxobacter paludicola]BDG07358.1 hypothetical protein AMPC_04710 [Anaeromyxobacter paludicola]
MSHTSLLRPSWPALLQRLLAAAAVLLALGGCHRQAVTYAKSEAGVAAPRPFAVFEGPSGRSSRVDLEVARTLEERNRGLMFRERLDANAGMLFVFESEDQHSFWMKNTYIPLDLVFIDEMGEITGVVEEAEPHSLAPMSGGPSRYVIEVNGGWCEAHGVRTGDRVRLENLPPVPAGAEEE